MGNVYDAVGGQQFFDELVERFYVNLELNRLLRPLYPEDLALPRSRLAEFLAQYWGGPHHYSNKRGHPRLRKRHAPFIISVYERNAWMDCMRAALLDMAMPEHIRDDMLEYFENAATLLINTTNTRMINTTKASITNTTRDSGNQASTINFQ